MRTELICALSALVGGLVTCSARDEAAVGSANPHRVRAPIHMVYASAEMSPDCRIATTLAVEHMQALGADLDLLFVENDHPAFQLEPYVGAISVQAGVMRDVNALAESFVWRTIGGTVLRAEVVVAQCAPFVIGHELAHCLGYTGQVDIERLWHQHEEHGWGIDASERF